MRSFLARRRYLFIPARNLIACQALVACRIAVQRGTFVRLKKSWTKPVVRRLDVDASGELTPQQRKALELLKRKARKAVAADG